MIDVAALPDRHSEAWRYSDLRKALRGVAIVDAPATDDVHPIARLSGGVERVALAPGERRLVVERPEGLGVEARAVEYDVGAGAHLTRVVLQMGGAFPLCLTRVRLGENSRFSQMHYSEGAQLARVETDVTIEGAGAEAVLFGAYLCAAGRHADLTSRVTHRVGGSRTVQLVKGAARAGGRGVFQGKIIVAEGAAGTDARQGHHGLMVEDGAEIDAKPELEIYADDVQCAHGATIGSLDADALFYLRSRGIGEAEARALLIEAFLAEAILPELDEGLREEIAGRMRGWLNGGAR